MRTLPFALIAFAFASAALAEDYRFVVDWKDPNSLGGGVVQMCDDTFYENIEIAVPGKPTEDFWVELPLDVTKGKIPVSSGCKISRKLVNGGAIYNIDPVDGGCDVVVIKRQKKHTDPKVEARFTISDAC
jgi:hypothetical protein